MWRRVSLIGVLSVALISVGATGATASKRDVLHATTAHQFPAKGAQPGGATSSPNLIYHNGPVQHGSPVTAIFWGSSWPSYVGDKVTGIGTFYTGVGNTHYAATNTEYFDGTTFVSPAVTYSGTLVDGSSAPRRAPSTSAVLSEVANALAAAHQSPVANGYYPVYVDTFRGHAGYCAWHSAGSINGIAVQFAFFFNLDGDPGCDPGTANDGHSQGLRALGNVSGHELSEMLTDPRLNAWYDSSGAENADKCAWTFSTNLVTFSNSSWKIQGNWSNAAYTAGSGYINAAGNVVRGCIDSK